MERESMLIYKSFVDVAATLNDKEYRQFWDAIHRYGLYGEEIPPMESPVLNALMVLIEPLLRANIRNYENGSKGGAPKGNKNAKTKTTQKQPGVKAVVESGLNLETTQKQGNVTVTVTDTANDNVTASVTANDTVNDTDTVNVNINKEICPYVDEKGIITDWDKFMEWESKHPNYKWEDDEDV